VRSMAYSIIISPLAQKEIENAIDYYALNSHDTPLNFVKTLKQTYVILSLNPFFRVRYKNIRSIKINKFPYSLYFVVDEKKLTIRVLSCFHDKLNPEKRPKQ
jgi:toxin ParE1/3/4